MARFETEIMGRERIPCGLGREDLARRLLEGQNSFLVDHLKPWVHEFCDDVIHNATLRFYEAFAGITKGFLSLEEESIPRLIKELNEMEQ